MNKALALAHAVQNFEVWGCDYNAPPEGWSWGRSTCGERLMGDAPNAAGASIVEADWAEYRAPAVTVRVEPVAPAPAVPAKYAPAVPAPTVAPMSMLNPKLWAGTSTLCVGHLTAQGVVAAVYKDEICILSSKHDGLTVYRRKEITKVPDTFEVLAQRILDGRSSHATSATPAEQMARILRSIHAEGGFQIAGVKA